MSASDSLGEYREPNDIPTLEELEEMDIDEMRVKDLRQGIYKILGVNGNPETKLTKREMNSIYAFFNGEWLIQKWRVARQGVPVLVSRDELRDEIIKCTDTDLEETVEKTYLAKDGLKSVYKAMRDQEDQRPFPDRN